MQNTFNSFIIQNFGGYSSLFAIMTNSGKTGGSGTWVEGDLGIATELVHAGVNPEPR